MLEAKRSSASDSSDESESSDMEGASATKDALAKLMGRNNTESTAGIEVVQENNSP